MRKAKRLQIGDVFTLPRHVESRLGFHPSREYVTHSVSMALKPADGVRCKEWVVVWSESISVMVILENRRARVWAVWARRLDDFGDPEIRPPVLAFMQEAPWHEFNIDDPLPVLRQATTLPMEALLDVSERKRMNPC